MEGPERGERGRRGREGSGTGSLISLHQRLRTNYKHSWRWQKTLFSLKEATIICVKNPSPVIMENLASPITVRERSSIICSRACRTHANTVISWRKKSAGCIAPPATCGLVHLRSNSPHEQTHITESYAGRRAASHRSRTVTRRTMHNNNNEHMFYGIPCPRAFTKNAHHIYHSTETQL